ncbi:anti-sigma factor domain-containing protein [Bacillaceae bacterium SIJ1]|uniref:anti-sigma factor domain-containing protein n=1 Tax=Litoribacterium kuwaitense TaxID=1398745 RepID=UPI0013EDB538|nr:anti-sigma factor domain-containing protein [Litoribacterium kuwaitense]NGP46337.1 anti-sigma factor domain-containing protein [Litoribacterium kuwaitense]
MTKGIVVDKKGKKTIILTRDGAFRRVIVKGNFHLGDEIDVPNRHKWSPWLPFASIVFLIMASLWIVRIPITHTMYDDSIAAYVSFDMNWSLEASLNESMEVISWSPISTIEDSFIQNLQFEPFIPFSLFVKNFLSASKKTGQVNPRSDMLVSLTVADGILPEQTKQLRQEIHEEIRLLASADNNEWSVTALQTNLAHREKALQQSVSPGKYVLYESLENQMTLDDVRASSFKQIKEQIAASPTVKWPESVASFPKDAKLLPQEKDNLSSDNEAVELQNMQ